MDIENIKNRIDISFLDKNLRYRKHVNKETQEEEYEQYVTLKSIIDLKLSEEEKIFAINYLGSIGVSVQGIYSYYNGLCDNYKQIGHVDFGHNNILTKEEEKECLENYQQTKDIEIRNKIVESNIPLVKYLCKKYAYLYDIDKDCILSYGYEGLIEALNKYDASKGKLSDYLSYSIKYFIFQGIVFSYFGEKGHSFLNFLGKKRNKTTKYSEYFYTKQEVEKTLGIRLKDEPDIIEDIAQILENKGYCEGALLEELKTRISINIPYSYEQIEEELHKPDADISYEEAIENVFQQELMEFLDTATKDLSKKRRNTLIRHYGLGGRKEESFSEIAKKEHIGYEAARSRGSLAKKELREKFTSSEYQLQAKTFLEYSNYNYEKNQHPVYKKRR